MPDAIVLTVVSDHVDVREIENVRLAVCCQSIVELDDPAAFKFVFFLLGGERRRKNNGKRGYYDEKNGFHFTCAVEWGSNTLKLLLFSFFYNSAGTSIVQLSF